jgi:superoxide dismutase, Cu-Zn family
MTTQKCLTGMAAVLLAGAISAAGADRKSATAELKDAKGQTVGQVTLKQGKNAVTLSAKVTNLPPGAHAIHVHTVGKCEAPDFKTAGGHFNPENKQHGLENPAGHHAGDMPNFMIADDGKGVYKGTLQGVTLAGSGANSLFHEGGTAVVIHEKADDMKTDPAGNAGARIACGPVQ